MMGVSVETWRVRIGCFHCNSHTSMSPQRSPTAHCHYYIALCIILVLLFIGNVEFNPGPLSDYFPCNFAGCLFKASTMGQHIEHQKLHVGIYGFRYSCPLPTCHASFSTYNNVSSHISQHTIKRTQVISDVVGSQCSKCDAKLITNAEMCLHLKTEHLKKEEAVMCPYQGCFRATPFTKLTQFNVHLSLYHPGWRQDLNSPGSKFTSTKEDTVNTPEFSASGADFSFSDLVFVGSDEDKDLEDVGFDDDSSEGSFNSSSNFDGECNFSYDKVIAYLANFYALLEGKHLVPSSTVNVIAQKLSFLSEILLARREDDLSNVLKSAKINPELISTILLSCRSMDPLYNSHHKSSVGVCLLTSHLRKSYYKKNFKYVEPIEINLKKDPHDREETIQYVDIPETLQVMLEDPTVQREVDTSFNSELLEDSPISDYPSGSIFRGSNNPKERIDLLLFMDAFTCVNPLGSAKNKFKINGMYMTLGNVKPHLRAYHQSIRLVLICADKLLKLSQKKFNKCFARVVRDLRNLEKDGILYKGKMIPVRLQFFQGDNLGQHTIGGFIECFSGNFFCRFCDLSREDFKKNFLQIGNWRTHDSFMRDLHMKETQNLDNYRGVKRDSPFNQLEYFKVCDPRLSPCLAHDLFVGGVVDQDVAAIIAHFVKKDWFTYPFLKMRIRRFKYDESDSRNKPADLHDGGEKLGGHAIQNWTLVRLLPFLIADKIKPEDKRWKLYRLLKRILEFACAPSLSPQQIELMRSLISKYMEKRKILPNKYKPKHHFFFHYADLFLKFGALIHHWTLAYEHFHQFFKKVARTCGNFINLGLTLASKFQLLQAYRSMENMYPTNPVMKKSFPLVPESYNSFLKDFLTTCGFSGNALDVGCLTLNNITYKKDQWLLLESDPNDDIYVGKIEVIVCDKNLCKVILSKFKASEWTDFGVFWINQEDPVRCILSLDSTLLNPRPHAVYMLFGYLCFSLKHVFLKME